jgi:urea transport system substrate-binding protein
VRIAREIASGLAVAHESGLIHRDVKPPNVWLEAGTGRVKLLDFGLARVVGSQSNLTQDGKVVGTPEYMSPEQARGQELDPRSDLFSLGAALYTMCTGERPFQGNSVMAVLTSLAVDTPRPVREINPLVPPALAALIDQLLQKQPSDRPESAQAVVEALEVIEADLPESVAGAARRRLTRRRPAWLVPLLVLGGFVLLGAVALFSGWFASRPEGGGPAPAGPSGPPIRIGVLHSQTGTMAISERAVIDAVLLAVDEINAQGGLLGRPVQPILADGRSDEEEFARRADKLITEDRVSTIFGCWTSASRKAVVPVVQRHNHLLVYPVQYEGAEQSPNVVYLGPVPNQQILPALRWLVGFEGKKRWFLVGSEYVFPVTANAVIHAEAKARGNTVLGEAYLPLGSTDVAGVVEQIAKAQPDLIVNTINGDTNVAFFRALRHAKSGARDLPALSLSLSEQELSALGPTVTVGDYVAANYFQSVDTPANRDFVARFHKRYGPERVVSSAMATAYAGVHLWAKAVRAAGSEDVHAIRKTIRGQTYNAPQGPIRIDPGTLHTVQTARVGRLDRTGRLLEVFKSPHPVEPEPFHESRSRQEWQTFLDDLHKRWGGRWSSPGP